VLHIYIYICDISRLRVNTASGIVTVSKWPSGAQVGKELVSFPTCAPDCYFSCGNNSFLLYRQQDNILTKLSFAPIYSKFHPLILPIPFTLYPHSNPFSVNQNSYMFSYTKTWPNLVSIIKVYKRSWSWKTPVPYFDVSLTVHLSITLANDQLNVQIFNTFITILYMYMFRAISCSSSGGQIVLIQHLVSSLSVSDRPVNRLRKN